MKYMIQSFFWMLILTGWGTAYTTCIFAQMPVTEVKMSNKGVPKLFINEEKTVPVMTFVNTAIVESHEVNERQIRYAAKYGEVHLHQINFNLPVNTDGSFNYFNMRRSLKLMRKGDPEGYAIIRLQVIDRFNSNNGYTNKDRIRFSDGTLSDYISIASDKWIKNAEKRIKASIKYSMQNPEYGKVIAGYFPESGEWFQREHRTHGVDVSDANTEKFRDWLFEKYKTNQNLQTSWNMEGITFGTAEIPGELIGKNQANYNYKKIMFDQPSDKKVLDYLDYYNDLTADRMIHLSRVIKNATDNKLLAGFFYGYLFDLPESKSGHYNLNKILNCPEIDFLAAPVSYRSRNEGEIGGSMSVIESIHKHGKIWFDECDYRSPIKTAEGIPFANAMPYVKTMDGLIEIFRRQYGYQMIRGNGCWPMDLMGMGWYDDKNFWKEIKKLNEMLLKYEKIRPAPSPEVALVIDEHGLALSENSKFTSKILWLLRNELYKVGINFGVYLRKDIEKGLVPGAKLFIMVGAFRLQAENVDHLASVLHQKGKTTLWIYGLGITPKTQVKKLLSENLNDSKQILYQSNELKADDIRNIARSAGVHIFNPKGYDPSMANGNLFVLHASGSGKRTLKFPKICDVYEKFSKTWFNNVKEISINVNRGKTYLFFYGEKSEISKSGICEIPNVNMKNLLQVYPNPSSDYININADSSSIQKLNLYGLTGKKLISQEVHDQTFVLNINDLVDGVYILKISMNDQMSKHKIIKTNLIHDF